MKTTRPHVRGYRSVVVRLGGLAAVAIAVATTTSVTNAAVGNSFLRIPGVTGAWPGDAYRSWIRVTGRYWVDEPNRFTITLGVGNPVVSGPLAPLPGAPSKLAIALDKRNPDLPQLMELCAGKPTIPEITFAEPAPHRVPAFPPYWEYTLKGVQFTACDVVAAAAEQALVVTFQDIAWLNYDSKGPNVVPVISTAADIPDIKPIPASPKTRTFLLTWFGWATLGDDETCPAMNSKTPQEEYYALLSKEEATSERASRGGGEVLFGQLKGSRRTPSPAELPPMNARGPHRLNVCEMPGIVRDPGHAEPQTTKASGVNLDGDDGTGAPPASVCKHTNFVAADGSVNGVDNQLFRVFGCIPGYRGKKGYLNQTHNARRADGNVVTLIEISGIDDPKNDDSVEIGIVYAQDKPMRSASGDFIPNYSFRMTKDPNFARFNQRLRARIVNGYVVTSPIKKWEFNNGQGGIVELADAQFRLHIEPNGDMKGVVGGYVDWHGLAAPGSAYNEGLFNFTCPGMYDSFKRNADGMKDPVTAECNGISMAYEIDAVPAFITPAAPTQLSQVSRDGR